MCAFNSVHKAHYTGNPPRIWLSWIDAGQYFELSEQFTMPFGSTRIISTLGKDPSTILDEIWASLCYMQAVMETPYLRTEVRAEVLKVVLDDEKIDFQIDLVSLDLGNINWSLGLVHSRSELLWDSVSGKFTLNGTTVKGVDALISIISTNSLPASKR